MELNRVNLIYFSPTNTTQKTLRAIASVFDCEVREYDITTDRSIPVPEFGAGELVIAGVPVYGGRIPAITEEFSARCRVQGPQPLPWVSMVTAIMTMLYWSWPIC